MSKERSREAKESLLVSHLLGSGFDTAQCDLRSVRSISWGELLIIAIPPSSPASPIQTRSLLPVDELQYGKKPVFAGGLINPRLGLNQNCFTSNEASVRFKARVT